MCKLSIENDNVFKIPEAIIVRNTEPILGLFVVIWMHFSCWIQIWQWKSEFWIFWNFFNFLFFFCTQKVKKLCSIGLMLNSYSNTKRFFIPLLHVHLCFWDHEHLSDRSISKGYPKSDTAPRVEKSSTSRALHAHDTWFYWSSENALHERLSLNSGVWVWMERNSSPLSVEKMLAFEYEFSLIGMVD